MAIDKISDPNVYVRNADGYTPAGLPYLDFTDLVASGVLETGEATAWRTLGFSNPDGMQFTYDLVFFGQLNDAPEIISVPAVEALAGGVYEYDVNAIDPEGDTLQYSKVVGPMGMTVVFETGAIKWSPTASDAGTHTVAIRVADGRGGQAEQHYNVTVLDNPTNRPPSFTSIPVVDAAINTPYVYQPSVADLDADSLTFSTSAVIDGLSVHPSTGAVTWTPSPDQFGLHSFEITVSDGRGGRGTQMFAINVGPVPGNNPPAFVTTAQDSTILGRDYVYQTRALDPDADALEYRLLEGPSMMAMDAATGRLTWNSADVVLGQHEVIVEAVDGRGGFSTQSFTLVVVVNHDPVIESTAPMAATVGQNYGYLLQASDQDQENLTVLLTTAPAGMTYNPATELIRWTPSGAQQGPNQVIVEVQDTRGGIATQGFTVTVGAALPNEPPDITSTPIYDSVADIAYRYQVIATDPNGDLPRFTLLESPTGMQIDEFSGRVTWVPSKDGTYDPVPEANFDVLGSTHVVVQVTDDRGGFDTQQYTILVRAVDNLPPHLDSVPPSQATFGHLYQYDAMASDPDGDELTYSIISATGVLFNGGANQQIIPPSMTIDPANGTLIWTPSLEDFASEVGGKKVYNLSAEGNFAIQELVVRATDGKGGVDIQAFPITVYLPNVPPVVTSTPPAEAVVDLVFSYEVRAQDPDSDVITFQLAEGPLGMAVDETSGVLTWTPSDSQLGAHPVTVLVQDDDGASTQHDFEILAVSSAVNHLPSITSSPRTAVQLGRNYLYGVDANDLDRDRLTYSLDVFPAGMTIDASTSIVSWTPAGEQLGTHDVTLRVEDGRGGIATQTFMLQVLAQGANLPPFITSRPVFGATAGEPYAYDLESIDPDGDLVVYRLASGPLVMSLDELAGTLRWTPGTADLGDHEVVIEALDPSGGIARQTFPVSVRRTNLPPSFVTTPPTQAAVDRQYSYGVGATDSEGDPLSIALVVAPTGMQLNPSNGLISWNPADNQIGEHAAEVRVTDPFGGEAIQAFRITVNDVLENLSPAITSAAPLVATIDGLYTYPVAASDPEAEPLRFELLAAPAGMTIQANTGLIQWAPRAGQAPEQMVTVAAVDSEGAQGTQTFTIAVRGPNHGPQINGQPAAGALPDELYLFDLMAVNPDGDPLTYRVETGPAGMTIDSNGRTEWMPTQNDLGTHSISLLAIDNRGAGARLRYDLTVKADEQSPMVQITLSRSPAAIGEPVTVTVRAVDDIKVQSLELRADGVPVVLDGDGRWTFTPAQVASVALVAKATDTVGNTTETTADLLVINPNATGAPSLAITSPEYGDLVTSFVDVIGTVDDIDGLLFYALSVAPFEGGTFHEFARGTTVVSDGVLGRFDPSVLENGDYFLRL